jgi:hypothetical protein
MLTVGATVWLAVLSGFVIRAQDTYTAKVPGGRAMSEFSRMPLERKGE